MPSAPHVIQRNHLRLRLAPDADGRAVHQRAAAALQSRPLLEALDAALSAAAGQPDDWLTLDRLELDLGRLDSTQLERQLLDRLPALLRRQVAEARAAVGSGAASAEAAELRTAAGTAWAAWQYFLLFGRLPAHWPAPTSSAAWETELCTLLANATEAQLAELRAALAPLPPRQRLIRQFSVELVAAVLGALDATARPHLPALAKALAPLLRPRKGVSGAGAELLLLAVMGRVGAGQSPPWPTLLSTLGGQPGAALTTPQALAKAALAVVEAAASALPDSATAPEPVADTASAAGVEYVENAGVVLLHPFLATCFAACGWLVGDDFVDEPARAQAVLLVHFLATGASQAPEYALRLPKLLCAVPAGAPLHQRRRLSRAARAEGRALLAAAIAHWSALKNTSSDGLREAFLQREGKLERASDGHPNLTVEQRAQDVLLDRLPYGWGLGPVQLPWMRTRLTINWA